MTNTESKRSSGLPMKSYYIFLMLVCILVPKIFSQGSPFVHLWHVAESDYRFPIIITVNQGTSAPILITPLFQSIPNLQPKSVELFTKNGIYIPSHLSTFGADEYQLTAVIPTSIISTRDTLYAYLLTQPSSSPDTLWCEASFVDVDNNKKPDGVLLRGDKIIFRRGFYEYGKRFPMGQALGFSSMMLAGDTINLLRGISTECVIAEDKIPVNRFTTDRVFKEIRFNKSEIAAEVLIKLDTVARDAFDLYLRYMIVRGLPVVQQSFFLVPNIAGNFSITSDQWHMRGLFLENKFSSMYSDHRGWEPLSKIWDTSMRYLICTDSTKQSGIGWMLPSRGVIRAEYASNKSYMLMYDSYAYHSDRLGVRNIWSLGSIDSMKSLFDAALADVEAGRNETKYLNILAPSADALFTYNDSLSVVFSSPGMMSSSNPSISVELISPTGTVYVLSTKSYQENRLWISDAFVFTKSMQEGTWKIRVKVDTTFLERSISLKTFEHPRLFFSSADLTNLGAKRFSGVHKKFWEALVSSCRSIQSNVARGLEPIATGADQKDIRGYEDRIQSLALRLLIEWNDTTWLALRKFVSTIMTYPEWGYEEGTYDKPFNNLDLTHSHFLMGLSCAYDWLYEYWTPTERRQLRTFIQKETNDWTTLPNAYWTRKYPTVDWQSRGTLTNNHYWINNASVELAARTLAGEVPDADTARWLDVVHYNLKQVLIALPHDGSSHEGIGYHTYGFRNLAKWIAARMRATNEEPMKSSSWFNRVSLYDLSTLMFGPAIPKNRYLNANIADCPLQGWGMPRSYSGFLASKTHDQFAQWLVTDYQESFPDPWTYIFTDESIVPAAINSFPQTVSFDDLGLLFHRSSWIGSNTYLAFKCGQMIGGHAQPDLNSFIIAKDGVPLAIDLGYSYKKMTHEHNTILIDGKGQIGEGTQWLAATPDSSDGMLKFIRQSDDIVHLRGDASRSYTDKRLKKFTRDIVVIDSALFLVLDDVQASDSVQWTWQLHTAHYDLYPTSWSFIRLSNNVNPFSNLMTAQGFDGWKINNVGKQLAVLSLQKNDSMKIDPAFYVPESKPEGGYNDQFNEYQYGYCLKQEKWGREVVFRNLLIASDSSDLQIYSGTDSILRITSPKIAGRFRIRQTDGGVQKMNSTSNIFAVHEESVNDYSMWYSGPMQMKDTLCYLSGFDGELLLKNNNGMVRGKCVSDNVHNLQFAFKGIQNPVVFIDSTQIVVREIQKDKLWEITFPSGVHDIIIQSGSTKIKETYNAKTIELFQNYPNPFTGFTAIGYRLLAFGHVKLEVFDILGRKVVTIVDEEQDAGVKQVELNVMGKKLNHGIYFYQLEANGQTMRKKMIILQ